MYDFWVAGTAKSEPPCRREHDFKVLSKSRKVLHFGVVLVPPFRAFGVSYRRKHCLERCLNFVHFLHRLLCYFRPPKWPPNHVKWRSIFGTIFYRSAGVVSGLTAVPSPPGTPLSFNSSLMQRPLRFAALPVTFLAWEREARLIMRVLPTYARSSHRPSQNLRIFQYA